MAERNQRASENLTWVPDWVQQDHGLAKVASYLREEESEGERNLVRMVSVGWLEYGQNQCLVKMAP